jgi:hypothetical protein
MSAANGRLGAAVRAMVGWVRGSGVAWPEFAREMTRGGLRAEWEAYAAELGLGLTGRDMLAGLAIALYGIAEAWGGEAGGGDAAGAAVEAAARDWIAAPEEPERLGAFGAALARWKAADREETLRRLAQMYWEYELAFRLGADGLGDEEREHYGALRDARQAELMSTMVGIDGGAFFRGFLPIAVSEEVAATVRATLTRAFWARIREDLTADPPVYDSLLPVLEELRAGVCEIMPRAWAAKAAWFSDLFDVGFLRERVGAGGAGGGLGADFWASRCSAAMEMLVELDSAEKARAHREWWARLGSGGEMDAAVEVLAYVLRRVEELREMKREAMEEVEVDTGA